MISKPAVFLMAVGAIDLANSAVPDIVNHCTICSGTSYIPNRDTVVLHGKTCEGLYYDALFNTDTDEICLSKYLFIGFTKCGCSAPVDSPPPNCSLCKDGSVPQYDYPVIDGQSGLTCGEAYNFLNNFQQTNDSCESFQLKAIEHCGCPDMIPSAAPTAAPSVNPTRSPSSQPSPIPKSKVVAGSSEQNQTVVVKGNGGNTSYIIGAAVAGGILFAALAAIRYTKSRRNGALLHDDDPEEPEEPSVFPLRINRHREHVIMIDTDEVELRASPSLVTQTSYADSPQFDNASQPYDERRNHNSVGLRQNSSYESEDTISL